MINLVKACKHLQTLNKMLDLLVFGFLKKLIFAQASKQSAI